MSIAISLVVMVGLLGVNAFFVGAEFAITASRKIEIEPLVKEGRRGAASALFAVEHVSMMLAVCQLGITLASTGLGVVAEPAIANLLTPLVEKIGASHLSAHSIAVVLALVIVLYLHVVLGEMIPKNLSISAHTRLILLYSPVMVGIEKLLRHLVLGMNHLANFFVRRLGLEPREEVDSTFTVEEVASIVEKSQAEGVLEDDLGLLSGTLEFSAELVSEVMTPLEHLVTLPYDVTPEQFEREVARTGFSRFPVTDREGQICGYLHIKDIIAVYPKRRDQALEPWRTHELIRVAADQEVEDALREMQKQGTHLVGVSAGSDDEDLVGVIFFEDILEELVGEVRDTLQREQ